MPFIQTNALTIPTRAQTGGNPVAIPSGFMNELVSSDVLGRYSTLGKSARLFSAYATLTAPVVFSTAAGTGGPLLWNKPNSGIDAHIIGVGITSSVITTVAGGLGFTGNIGQVIAPTSTTAIDASGPLYLGGAVTQLGGVFRVGTPTNAGNIFIPIMQFHTGALTVDNTTGPQWLDIGGSIIVPPGGWASIAGTATLTTLQCQVGLVWAELPT